MAKSFPKWIPEQVQHEVLFQQQVRAENQLRVLPVFYNKHQEMEKLWEKLKDLNSQFHGEREGESLESAFTRTLFEIEPAFNQAMREYKYLKKDVEHCENMLCNTDKLSKLINKSLSMHHADYIRLDRKNMYDLKELLKYFHEDLTRGLNYHKAKHKDFSGFSSSNILLTRENNNSNSLEIAFIRKLSHFFKVHTGEPLNQNICDIGALIFESSYVPSDITKIMKPFQEWINEDKKRMTRK
jgi:hypothetical protein